MAFFKRRKTMKRCMALQSYVHGINSDTARKMTDFLMQNKRNYICTNRQFLMFVTGAGAVALTMPISPIRNDFDSITLTCDFAQIVSAPGEQPKTYRSVSNTTTAGSDTATYDDDEDSGDFGLYTNNNNNNNNNNNG
jgi:hypothetical protein